jgi:hypothetical protein
LGDEGNFFVFVKNKWNLADIYFLLIPPNKAPKEMICQHAGNWRGEYIVTKWRKNALQWMTLKCIAQCTASRETREKARSHPHCKVSLVFLFSWYMEPGFLHSGEQGFKGKRKENPMLSLWSWTGFNSTPSLLSKNELASCYFLPVLLSPPLNLSFPWHRPASQFAFPEWEWKLLKKGERFWMQLT